MATRMSQTCAPYSHNKKSFIVGSDVLRMRMSSGMWRAPYALQEGPSCTGGALLHRRLQDSGVARDAQ